jgi:hypothetical protein
MALSETFILLPRLLHSIGDAAWLVTRFSICAHMKSCEQMTAAELLTTIWTILWQEHRTPQQAGAGADAG